MFRLIVIAVFLVQLQFLMNFVKTEHIVRRSAVNALFAQSVYNDLDLRFKSKFVFEEIYDVKENYDCLSECNYNRSCRFGYFLNSVCYLCNVTAQIYQISFLDTPGKKSPDGTLFQRIR